MIGGDLAQAPLQLLGMGGQIRQHPQELSEGIIHFQIMSQVGTRHWVKILAENNWTSNLCKECRMVVTHYHDVLLDSTRRRRRNVHWFSCAEHR